MCQRRSFSFIAVKAQTCNNDFYSVSPFGQIFAEQFNIRIRNASVAEDAMYAWAREFAIITLHRGERVNFPELMAYALLV
jgi:hypothetical protein